MKIPVTVVGFGLFVVGSAVFGQFRANYLRRISDEILVDSSKQIILRYAIWVYIVPLLGFGLASMFGWDALSQTNSVRFKFDVVFCVITFLGGIFALYRFATGRVTIFEGKLIYTEGGDRWEVSADDVRRFSFNGLTFLVKEI